MLLSVISFKGTINRENRKRAKVMTPLRKIVTRNVTLFSPRLHCTIHYLKYGFYERFRGGGGRDNELLIETVVTLTTLSFPKFLSARERWRPFAFPARAGSGSACPYVRIEFHISLSRESSFRPSRRPLV